MKVTAGGMAAGWFFGKLVAARGDMSEVFQAAEHALDQVAFSLVFPEECAKSLL